jgi:hypothetical protein
MSEGGYLITITIGKKVYKIFVMDIVIDAFKIFLKLLIILLWLIVVAVIVAALIILAGVDAGVVGSLTITSLPVEAHACNLFSS